MWKFLKTAKRLLGFTPRTRVHRRTKIAKPKGIIRRLAEGAEASKPSAGIAVSGDRISRPRGRFFLRARSDGVPDILDAIQDLGGIKSPAVARDAAKGDYDGFREAFRGEARLLIRRKGGMAPDELVEHLTNEASGIGQIFRLESTSDLYDAVDRAVKERRAVKSGSVEQAGRAEFWNVAVDNRGRRSHGAGCRAGVPVGDLQIADRFSVKGEGCEVREIDPESYEVAVQCGGKYRGQLLPDGGKFYPDSCRVDTSRRAATGEDFVSNPKRKLIKPGAELIFHGWDGKDYKATVISRPKNGLVKIRYHVPGLGMTSPPVLLSRLSVNPKRRAYGGGRPAQGDLFGGGGAFRLAGETGVDHDRRQRETAQREADRKQSEKGQTTMLSNPAGSVFSKVQLDKLREESAKIGRVDPDSPTLKKLREFISRLTDQQLAQLAGAKIQWMTYLSKSELERRRKFQMNPARRKKIGRRVRVGDSSVRSPTSTRTEVRSPTSTATEVRSPTSTATDAYTAGNVTVTGGAGRGATTRVSIIQSKPEKNGKRGLGRAAKRETINRREARISGRAPRATGLRSPQSSKPARRAARSPRRFIGKAAISMRRNPSAPIFFVREAKGTLAAVAGQKLSFPGFGAFTFFGYQDAVSDLWGVAEAKSGASIASDQATKAKAIYESGKALAGLGLVKVRRLISSLVKKHGNAN